MKIKFSVFYIIVRQNLQINHDIVRKGQNMKKRYSEYIGYKYSMDDEWFNPQVEWDTELFIDPVLLKDIEIPEFKDSYQKIVNYFSKVLEKIEDGTIPIKLKENMVDFIEVKEANLGYSYDSNDGRGLTGKTALRLMNNLTNIRKIRAVWLRRI